MSARNIAPIDGFGEPSPEQESALDAGMQAAKDGAAGSNPPREEPKLVVAAKSEDLVSMNYPHRVALTTVLGEVARWSDYSIVMEPSLNREVQIFAPHKVSRDQAFNLLVAALETVGLRVIRMNSSMIKVVPAKGEVSA